MTPEQILRELIAENFHLDSDGGLSWGWIEGVTIQEYGRPEFVQALYELLYSVPHPAPTPVGITQVDAGKIGPQANESAI